MRCTKLAATNLFQITYLLDLQLLITIIFNLVQMQPHAMQDLSIKRYKEKSTMIKVRFHVQ